MEIFAAYSPCSYLTFKMQRKRPSLGTVFESHRRLRLAPRSPIGRRPASELYLGDRSLEVCQTPETYGTCAVKLSFINGKVPLDMRGEQKNRELAELWDLLKDKDSSASTCRGSIEQYGRKRKLSVFTCSLN